MNFTLNNENNSLEMVKDPHIVKFLWELNEDTSLSPIAVLSNERMMYIPFKSLRARGISIGSELIGSPEEGFTLTSIKFDGLKVFRGIMMHIDPELLMKENELKLHPALLKHLGTSKTLEDPVQLIRDCFYIGAETNIIDPDLMPPEDDEVTSERSTVKCIEWESNNEFGLFGYNPVVVMEDGQRFHKLSYSMVSYYGINTGAELRIKKSGDIEILKKSYDLLTPPKVNNGKYIVFGSNLYIVPMDFDISTIKAIMQEK